VTYSLSGHELIEWAQHHPDEVIAELLDANRRAAEFSSRVYQLEHRLITHSMLAYPHVWLWHAIFDGTRLCGCWRSKEMRKNSEVQR
jgi:hypothetical protein